MSKRCSFESLEARRLFATFLDLQGTTGNDRFEVTSANNGVNVKQNGVTTFYGYEGFVGINIYCDEGDDVVIIAAGILRGPEPVGVYTDLGNGNDKFVGGDGPDTILGAAGKDQIYGGGGNDRINGAGGNDKIFGEAGSDRLYGGAGNDYIDGGSSVDRFYPNDGLDTCLGQSGNDIMFAIDEAADQLFGGSGSDIAHVDSQDVRGSIEQIAIV